MEVLLWDRTPRMGFPVASDRRAKANCEVYTGPAHRFRRGQNHPIRKTTATNTAMRTV